MPRRLLIITSVFLFFILRCTGANTVARHHDGGAQPGDHHEAAEQYKVLLPGILLGLRRELTQDRPEIERDYDTMKPMIEAAYPPYYATMLNDVAAVYANNFTVAELREMEAFFQRPAGQKYLEKAQALTQQTNQVAQDDSRKAAEDLRARLTEALRQKGHKL